MTGMMWVDLDPKSTLEQKIQKAAAYYLKKYGQAPALCQVNPAALDGDSELMIDGIAVEISPEILPHHFFIIPEEPDGQASH